MQDFMDRVRKLDDHQQRHVLISAWSYANAFRDVHKGAREAYERMKEELEHQEAVNRGDYDEF